MTPFVYLSFGAGVQSSALLACSSLGLHGVPRAEVAIFADTQDEPTWVYEQVDALRRLSSIPIETVTNGQLSAADRKFVRLPAFTKHRTTGEPGILNRQCTRDYKILPIQRHVRALMGYRPRQRIKRLCVALVGISLDEVQRVAPSKEPWIERKHPLVDANLTRADCVAILEGVGWPVPKKSACVFCPFHDDATWLDLKTHYPEQWAKAVAIDTALRDAPKQGIKQLAFLHAQRVPLSEVDLRPSTRTKRDQHQMRLSWDSFSEECAGVCGV